MSNYTIVSSVNELQTGDHISWPALISCDKSVEHHAIVVAQQGGNKTKLIHVILAGLRESGASRALATDSICGSNKARAAADPKVVEQIHDFTKELKDGSLRRYVYAPGSCNEPVEVVEYARSHLGKYDFNLYKNNCESFARLCKTGNKKSYQAEAAKNNSSCVCL